ncbi:unnamed protein product [Leuciscus chuanchicus]
MVEEMSGQPSNYEKEARLLLAFKSYDMDIEAGVSVARRGKYPKEIEPSEKEKAVNTLTFNKNVLWSIDESMNLDD